MRARVTLATWFLLSSTAIGSRADVITNEACRDAAVPIQVQYVPSHDIYRAANVEGGKVQQIRFSVGSSAVDNRILKVDPLTWTALLADGSAIRIIRDVDGDGRILSVRRVKSGSCWSGSSDYRWSTAVEKQGVITVSDYPPGAPRELLRVNNKGGFGRLFRVLQFRGRSSPVNEVISPILVIERPIDAIGVSVPSIEGGWRSMLLLSRQKDGSLIVAAYSYSNRSWHRTGK